MIGNRRVSTADLDAIRDSLTAEFAVRALADDASIAAECLTAWRQAVEHHGVYSQEATAAHTTATAWVSSLADMLANVPAV